MTARPSSLNIYLFLFSISQDVRGSLSPFVWSLVPRFALPPLLLLLRCISISHPPPPDRGKGRPRNKTKTKNTDTSLQSMTPEIRFPCDTCLACNSGHLNKFTGHRNPRHPPQSADADVLYTFLVFPCRTLPVCSNQNSISTHHPRR